MCWLRMTLSWEPMRECTHNGHTPSRGASARRPSLAHDDEAAELAGQEAALDPGTVLRIGGPIDRHARDAQPDEGECVGAERVSVAGGEGADHAPPLFAI